MSLCGSPGETKGRRADSLTSPPYYLRKPGGGTGENGSKYKDLVCNTREDGNMQGGGRTWGDTFFKQELDLQA
jgi:hypothetical protein